MVITCLRGEDLQPVRPRVPPQAQASMSCHWVMPLARLLSSKKPCAGGPTRPALSSIPCGTPTSICKSWCGEIPMDDIWAASHCAMQKLPIESCVITDCGIAGQLEAQCRSQHLRVRVLWSIALLVLWLTPPNKRAHKSHGIHRYLAKYRPFASGLLSQTWEPRFFTLNGTALQARGSAASCPVL